MIPAPPRVSVAAGLERQKLTMITRVLLLIALYFVGGLVGKEASFLSGNMVLVWPPAGIALAAILLFGYRFWPGVALGAVLFSFTNGTPFGFFTLGTAIGNTMGGGRELPKAPADWIAAAPCHFFPKEALRTDVLSTARPHRLSGQTPLKFPFLKTFSGYLEHSFWEGRQMAPEWRAAICCPRPNRILNGRSTH